MRHLHSMASDAFIVLGKEQSALAFCDLGCFNVFTVYQDCSSMVNAKALKANKKACFYCASCGRAVNKSTKCMLHEDGCPDHLWFASYPMMADFLEEWATMFNDTEISEETWEIIDRIAEANPLIPGSELAQLVIKKLGY
jgi:hypothetical protein